MSDNKDLDAFRNSWNKSFDYAGSQGAGNWQAGQGQPLSGQQSNESWASFQTRQNAYDNTLKNK